MKVLMLNGPDQKMGAPKSLFGICNEWKKKNIEIVVFTQNRGELNDRLDSLHIRNYVVPYCNILTKNNYKILRIIRECVGNFISLLKVKKLMNSEKFDVIYSSSSIFRFGAELAKKYKIPHIWHIREFGFEDYELIALVPDFYEYMNNNCDAFISISNAIRECWIRKGLNKNKIYNIYNGIDSDLITMKSHNNMGEKIKIVFCGSISKAKGQYQLIEAIAAMDNSEREKVIVDIWGDSTDERYLRYLKERVHQLKLDNIFFRGYNSNIYDVLYQYDIGVVASKCEGFGRVTVEYMLANICVIASNTGANCELIYDNIDGVIYEYGSVESLKDKLKYVIENADIRQSLASNGREKALKLFTAEKNAEDILNLAYRVISERKSANSQLKS